MKEVPYVYGKKMAMRSQSLILTSCKRCCQVLLRF